MIFADGGQEQGKRCHSRIYDSLLCPYNENLSEVLSWIEGHRMRILISFIFLLFTFNMTQAQVGECPMQPVLTVGTTGQVVAGGANNVRTEPNSTATILGQIPLGATFTVNEGSICADGYQWWYVSYGGSTEGWTAEGSDGEYWLMPFQAPTASGVMPPLDPVFAAHLPPNTITASNAVEVAEQAVLGEGWISDLAWSSVNSTIAVATTLGIRLYDITQPDTAPAILDGQDHYVNDVAFSPDGTLLASASDDHTIQIWDVATKTIQFTLQHEMGVKLIDFSPDGTQLAAAEDWRTIEGQGRSAKIQIWDMESRRPYREWDLESFNATRMEFTPDGTGLFTQNIYGADLWNILTGERKPIAGQMADWVYTAENIRVAFVYELLGDGPAFQTLIVGDTATQTSVIDRDVSEEPDIEQVYITPDAELFLTLDRSGVVAIRSVDHPTGLATATSNATQVVFSPSAKYMITGHLDGTIRLFTTPVLQSDGQVYFQTLNAFYGISSSIKNIAFSPDEAYLGATDSTGKFIIWEVETGNRVITDDGFMPPVTTLTFSPNGKLLASGDNNGNIALWDTETPELRQTFSGHSYAVKALAFNHDSSYLASSDGVGRGDTFYSSTPRLVQLWNTATSEALGRVNSGAGDKSGLIFGSDGSILVSQAIICSQPGNPLQSILFVDGVLTLADSPPVQGLNSCNYGGTAFSITPDHHWVVLGGKLIVDMDNDRTIKAIPNPGLRAQQAVFNHDGSLLAISYNNNNINLISRVIVWDLAAPIPTAIAIFEEGDRPIFDLALSADGSVLASASEDGTIRLWDVVTGQLVTTLYSAGGVNGIQFSPDGAVLASANTDGTVRLWRIPSAKN